MWSDWFGTAISPNWMSAASSRLPSRNATCIFEFGSEAAGLGRLKHRRNCRLGSLLNLPQMLLAYKAFRVDLVDILGSGRPCGKPSVFRHHLDAAERLIVAGSSIQRRAHRLAGKLLDGELLRRQRLQQILLRDRRARVDPVTERHAQFIGETIEQLTGVLFGPRGDLGGEQAENDAVLVGGPDRAIAPDKRGAGALLAGKTERAANQAIDEPFEAHRGLDQLAAE